MPQFYAHNRLSQDSLCEEIKSPRQIFVLKFFPPFLEELRVMKIEYFGRYVGEREENRGEAIFNICQAVIGFMIRTKELFNICYNGFISNKSHFIC